MIIRLDEIPAKTVKNLHKMRTHLQKRETINNLEQDLPVGDELGREEIDMASFNGHENEDIVFLVTEKKEMRA